MDSIEKLYQAINELEQLKRTGWILYNVPAQRLESVADHTLQVIVLATTFVHEKHLDYDPSKLVQMCFIHDIGEALVGDVAEVDINYNQRKVLERKKTIEFLSTLPESLSCYLEYWQEVEERKTPLANFIYQVDKLDALLKAKKYSEEYNMPALFTDFYNYQLEKETFKNGPLKEIFDNLKMEEK